MRGNLKLKTTTYVLLFLSIFSANFSLANKPRKKISFIQTHLVLNPERFEVVDLPNFEAGFRCAIIIRREDACFPALTLKLLCGLEAPKRSRSFLTLFKFLMSVSSSSSHFILPKKSIPYKEENWENEINASIEHLKQIINVLRKNIHMNVIYIKTCLD